MAIHSKGKTHEVFSLDKSKTFHRSSKPTPQKREPKKKGRQSAYNIEQGKKRANADYKIASQTDSLGLVSGVCGSGTDTS